VKPLDHIPLWDQAYAALHDAILEGRFAPGERLLLRDIADELKISLTPVRDAVNRLVAEHVLERGSPGQGGGAVVPRITAETFRELLLIRGDLEGRAAFHAAQRATDDDVAALEALLGEMLGLIKDRQLDRYLGVHRRFHFRIYAISGMSVLRQMIDNLWQRCGPALTYVIPAYVTLLKGTDFHKAALDALRRRDPAAAAAAIRADITDAGAYILSLADGDGWITPPER
jgi:DNA-binding GntR family transcriptional regulator